MRVRGYTVPRGALYALRVANEALRMQLPLTAPAALGAARARRSKIRKQAPLTPHTLVGMILLLTQNSNMPFSLLAVASGISLMVLATFRRADAHRVAEINRIDSVVPGIPQRIKSNYGPFYWAAPLEGILNPPKRIEPVLIVRAKYAASGAKPRFIFTHCNDDWALDSSRPMKYAATLACFRRIATLCGIGDKFTLRSPRAVLPTCDAHLGWRKEDRTALGRRDPKSEMRNLARARGV